MSVFTKFLKLIKPQNHEYYNVEHFNHNSELIDKKMEEHDTALTTIQRGATNEQKGIVQFGIEEGKALEGNMLARLAGAYGFGGDIQNPGVKNQNYIYYDNNTRKMYKCLNQNSDTSANVQNYVPIDNFSFLERLENLYNNTVESGYYKIGMLIIQWGYVKPGIHAFPIAFPNECLSIASSGSGSGNNETTSLYIIDKNKFNAIQQQGKFQRYIAVGY